MDMNSFIPVANGQLSQKLRDKYNQLETLQESIKEEHGTFSISNDLLHQIDPSLVPFNKPAYDMVTPQTTRLAELTGTTYINDYDCYQQFEELDRIEENYTNEKLEIPYQLANPVILYVELVDGSDEALTTSRLHYEQEIEKIRNYKSQLIGQLTETVDMLGTTYLAQRNSDCPFSDIPTIDPDCPMVPIVNDNQYNGLNQQRIITNTSDLDNLSLDDIRSDAILPPGRLARLRRREQLASSMSQKLGLPKDIVLPSDDDILFAMIETRMRIKQDTMRIIQKLSSAIVQRENEYDQYKKHLINQSIETYQNQLQQFQQDWINDASMECAIRRLMCSHTGTYDSWLDSQPMIYQTDINEFLPYTIYYDDYVSLFGKEYKHLDLEDAKDYVAELGDTKITLDRNNIDDNFSMLPNDLEDTDEIEALETERRNYYNLTHLDSNTRNQREDHRRKNLEFCRNMAYIKENIKYTRDGDVIGNQVGAHINFVRQNTIMLSPNLQTRNGNEDIRCLQSASHVSLIYMKLTSDVFETYQIEISSLFKDIPKYIKSYEELPYYGAYSRFCPELLGTYGTALSPEHLMILHQMPIYQNIIVNIDNSNIDLFF